MESLPVVGLDANVRAKKVLSCVHAHGTPIDFLSLSLSFILAL